MNEFKVVYLKLQDQGARFYSLFIDENNNWGVSADKYGINFRVYKTHKIKSTINGLIGVRNHANFMKEAILLWRLFFKNHKNIIEIKRFSKHKNGKLNMGSVCYNRNEDINISIKIMGKKKYI